MKFKIKHCDLAEVTDDLLLIGVKPEPDEEFTRTLQTVKKMVNNKAIFHDISEKKGQIVFCYPPNHPYLKRIIFVGLGDKTDPGALDYVFGEVFAQIRKMDISTIAVAISTFRENSAYQEMAQKIVELVTIGNYDYQAYRKSGFSSIKQISLICHQDHSKQIRQGARQGSIIGEAVNYTRDLQNHPPNYLTPKLLAKTAKQLSADLTLSFRALEKRELKQLKMGALLGVAQGSIHPPRLLILEYKSPKASGKPVVLVGKGITFDSGGISLKRSSDMDEMKFDMSGAAAVLGAFKAISEMKLPINVVGLIPVAENMPGGTALRPGDILTASSGTTIEIKNTDAEGRLILADALTYAKKYKPDAVIDLATLTGGCVVALGYHMSGLMGNNQALIDEIKEAANCSGEQVWQLPLTPEYYDDIKADFAEIKNSTGSAGNAVTAAAFLGTFTQDYPWAHLDIAGTANTTARKGVFEKGGTGVGVRLLVAFLRARSIDS